MPSALVATNALSRPESRSCSRDNRSVASVCPEYAATAWPFERRCSATSWVAATVRV